jgi:transcriptional regulator with XRE-family HTH domain
MGRPRLRTSEFAAWLARQRGGRSLEDVARKARKGVGGVIAFDRSSWKKLEAGQLPNIVQLWGIAKALDVPLLELARRIVQDLEVPVNEPGTLRQTPPLGADADAIARRYELADDAHRAAVRLILDGAPVVEPRAAGKEKRDDQRTSSGRRRPR